MLEIRCPSCAKLLQVIETATAHESQCPACATVFRPENRWDQESPAPTRVHGQLEIRTHSSVASDQSAAVSDALCDNVTDATTFADPVDHSQSVRHTLQPLLIKAPLLGVAVGFISGLFMYIRVGALHAAEDVLYIFGAMFWLAVWFAVYGFVLHISTRPAYRWLARLSVAAALGFFAFVYFMLFFVNPHENALGAVHAMTVIVSPVVLFCHLLLAVLIRMVEGVSMLLTGFYKAAGRPTRRNASQVGVSDWDRNSDDEDAL